jgi:DNA invertase Pin-like site-specific DNA recombinase
MTPRKENESFDRIPVVALIRVSTEEQATEDKGGIPAQQDAIKRIAQQHDLDIRWTVQIEGVSGAVVMQSQQMKEVLRIVRGGVCKGIVMKEESRLMRAENFEDYAILQTLQQHGVKIYLVDGVMDLSKAGDKLFSHIKFAFAGYERTIIRDRMLGGKKAKRRRGEWVAGPNSVAFGLKLVKDGKINRLQVDDASIHRVQHLFQLFISGVTSFGKLARETGISYYSIPYILENEIYAGVHVPRKTVDPNRNVYRDDGSLRYQRRLVVPVTERERIQVLDNPPISPEVFAQAQWLLKLKREMRWKRTQETEDLYIYRGFLRCAECGMRLTTVKYLNKQANNFRADYYVCRAAHGAARANGTWQIKPASCKTRRIRREVLEPMLDDLVVRRFANPNFLLELIEAHSVAETQAAVTKTIERLHLEIEEADRAIERNQEMYIRGKISQAVFDKNDHNLQLEKRTSEVELAKLRPNVEQITPEMWVPIARQFQRWPKVAPQQKKVLLAAIAPIFIVGGYAGEKYHDTVVKVKGCHVNLTGEHLSVESDKSAEGEGSEEEDVLVDIGSRLYSGRDVNQSSIYIPF